MFDRLTSYLDSLEDTFGVPYFDIVVTQNHKEIYRHRKGIARRAGNIPVSSQTVYDFFSATKVITAVAVMQLVEKGILSVEDRLSDILPAFSEMWVAEGVFHNGRPMRWPQESDPCHPAINSITIDHLLTMRAGLNYDVFSPTLKAKIIETGGAGSTIDIVNAMAQMPLLFEPGEHYAYSFAFDVLGAVVEKVSGERYADYLNRHIFQPLGVRDLYLHISEENAAMHGDFYGCDLGTTVIRPRTNENVYRLTKNFDSGGAGLSGTVDGYAAVLDALACGGEGKNGSRILTAESIAKIAKPRLTETQQKEFAGDMRPGYSYGYGVRTLVSRESSLSPVGEFGWDGAAGAYVLIDPKNRLGVFYAQHVQGMISVYKQIHPTIRDLIYSCCSSDTPSA